MQKAQVYCFNKTRLTQVLKNTVHFSALCQALITFLETVHLQFIVFSFFIITHAVLSANIAVGFKNIPHIHIVLNFTRNTIHRPQPYSQKCNESPGVEASVLGQRAKEYRASYGKKDCIKL